MTSTIKTVHLDNVIAKHAQDIANKVVIVTGTTSGTGFVCAREVAKKGASVLLLNRDSKRSASGLEKLKEEQASSGGEPYLHGEAGRPTAREVLRQEWWESGW